MAGRDEALARLCWLFSWLAHRGSTPRQETKPSDSSLILLCGRVGGNKLVFMCINHVYRIKWAKSKKLLDGYIDRYNADRPLREQLRSSHKALAQHLLFLYSAALAREQAYGGGVELYNSLPRLRTNNVQLSKALGCSERTIINLRARLKEAKVILKERFRGSNAQYEVELSGAVIHIQTTKEPENIIHLFQPAAKTLRHTVTRTNQVTKELIKLDGADFQQCVGFQLDRWSKAVDKGFRSCGKVGNVVENTAIGSILGTQGTRSGYETISPSLETPPGLRGAPRGSGGGEVGNGKSGSRKWESGKSEKVRESEVVKGEKVKVGSRRSAGNKFESRTSESRESESERVNVAPGTLNEALEGLSKKDADSVRRHVQVIWTCALLNLYDDKWIADEEAVRAKAVLAEYLIYADPSRYQAGAAEVIERIILVRRWIERGQKQGIKRWVPLPSRYFDYRNQQGFTRTKPWFKAHIKAKAEIKAKELLTKAIKEYLKAQEPGAKVGPSETYRRLSQRLGKHDRALLTQFHAQIANIHAPQAIKTAS